MRKISVLLAMLVVSVLAAYPAHSADLYPWNNHAAPLNFLFGNDFDTHQQTRQYDGGLLFGFFYVSFNGVVTKDGYRVASHADCNSTPCTVGWILDGKRRMATFLYEAASDHPVFLLPRQEIPEPGAFSHFHWLGAEPTPGEARKGYLLQLTAVDTFCFFHHLTGKANSTISCRDAGGIPVKPGIDIATHLNIVTSVSPEL